MSRAFSLYLDAIRFLAALLVLFYHANWIYRPGVLFTSLGHEAVVIFFVLCGFVIAFVADTRETDFGDSWWPEAPEYSQWLFRPSFLRHCWITLASISTRPYILKAIAPETIPLSGSSPAAYF
jgi:hypothetical protein